MAFICFRMEIIQDSSAPKESTDAEILEMRKMYENERMSNKTVS